MEVYMINEFKNKIKNEQAWHFDDVVDLKAKEPKDIKPLASFFRSSKGVSNYENYDLYRIEKQIRKWFDIKLQDEKWIRSRGARTYTCRMVVEEAFGRPYDLKLDSKYGAIYAKILSHYAITIHKGHWDRERQKYRSGKKSYVLSVPRIRNVRPYSIRLRLEVEGKTLEESTFKDTEVYKSLQAGDSRKRETQDHMDMVSKKLQDIYYEQQKQRNSKDNK